MAEERPLFPLAEMMVLWQKMMWEGFEMMMKGPALAAALAKSFEASTGFHELMQKNMQAGLKAMNLPTADDLRRITESVAAMQAQLDATKGYLEIMERAVRLQDDWRKGVDETIQRLLAYQEEGQMAFQTWKKQAEDRVQDLQHVWDEGIKRWAENLQQAVETFKAIQKMQ